MQRVRKEEEFTAVSLLPACKSPIWKKLITWAQDITQQNVTAPNTAWQKIQQRLAIEKQ